MWRERGHLSSRHLSMGDTLLLPVDSCQSSQYDFTWTWFPCPVFQTLLPFWLQTISSCFVYMVSSSSSSGKWINVNRHTFLSKLIGCHFYGNFCTCFTFHFNNCDMNKCPATMLSCLCFRSVYNEERTSSAKNLSKM